MSIDATEEVLPPPRLRLLLCLPRENSQVTSSREAVAAALLEVNQKFHSIMHISLSETALLTLSSYGINSNNCQLTKGDDVDDAGIVEISKNSIASVRKEAGRRKSTGYINRSM